MSESWGASFLAKVLGRVERPGRYAGGEWNAKNKDPRRVAAKIGLAFPDVYEIGMSYLGQKILYGLINDHPDYLAERIFAPWPDFEIELRKHDIPLCSLENKIPLSEFDILGFSLLYELNYSNILTILDLGRVPLRSKDRSAGDPLVIAGGPAAFNPEPVADFFDAYLLGDGEEAFLEIIATYLGTKGRTRGRADILKALAEISGVYVPLFYEAHSSPKSRLLAVKPTGGAPDSIRKRIVSSFSRSYFPEDIIVPSIQVVFDRVAVEVSRGCPQKCRFCQATSLYAPPRTKDPDFVVQKVFGSLRATGYEDASLFSLSVGDYPYLEKTVRTLMEGLERDCISLSLSSLRPQTLSAGIVRDILRVRKTGFTLVPEAGSERLRKVINKNLSEEEIWQAAELAFGQGWKLLKLYFMIGLPTEREEDLLGIVALVSELIERGRKILKTFPRIHLSLSSFIPKPHTPFQWLAMDEENLLEDKHAFLRSRLRRLRGVQIKEHPVKNSILEAVFSRGDRRLGAVLHGAWQAGARFDSWRDKFRFALWQAAFEKEGLDARTYLAPIDTGAALPWDHIQTGMKKSYLSREMNRALREERSPSCYDNPCDHCRGCEYWADIEKEFVLKTEIHGPEYPRLGRLTDRVRRYQAFYEKLGPARFISHNDLVNVLQRSFRRAGIAAVYSKGFHPKMAMSFVPALPLGMEGWDESLEFQSPADMTESEFISGLNRNVPPGVRFTALKTIGAGSPSLAERIQSMTYSLDMDVESVREALARWAGPGCVREDVFWSLAEERLRNFQAGPGDPIESIGLDRSRRKLVIRLRMTFQRSPRPQDLAARIFGLAESVSIMARERINFSSSRSPHPDAGRSTIDRP